MGAAMQPTADMPSCWACLPTRIAALLRCTPSHTQAFLQFHVKAAKSDLHCRMRQRLGALRQQLALSKC